MPERRTFGDREELAQALAETVAERLSSGIAGRGIASLAVSGGSTPAKFFAALSHHEDIVWEKVVVTLVDERWVHDFSDRSNARLVKGALLRGPAIEARFVPLYSGGDELDAAAIERTNAAVADVPQPFDAVILGMGNDGHTASFFPGGDNLREALEGAGPALAIRAPGAREPRVTLSLSRLLQTRGLYLHIEGEEKAAVLEKALADGPVEEMPVRALLRQTQTPVTVFWSP
jgi:6-phosphogluconolactonase